MFGLGFQELLLVGVILVLFVFVNPAISYTILLLGLKILKSPGRVLIAFWVLGIVFSVATSHGDTTRAFMTALFATPFSMAIQFGWLWLMGCLWQKIGLSRPGSAFRNMALLYFKALRPKEEIG
jgi:hypothetical protein